jgi:hypothetical protein
MSQSVPYFLFIFIFVRGNNSPRPPTLNIAIRYTSLIFMGRWLRVKIFIWLQRLLAPNLLFSKAKLLKRTKVKHILKLSCSFDSVRLTLLKI